MQPVYVQQRAGKMPWGINKTPGNNVTGGAGSCVGSRVEVCNRKRAVATATPVHRQHRPGLARPGSTVCNHRVAGSVGRTGVVAVVTNAEPTGVLKCAVRATR